MGFAFLHWNWLQPTAARLSPAGARAVLGLCAFALLAAPLWPNPCWSQAKGAWETEDGAGFTTGLVIQSVTGAAPATLEPGRVIGVGETIAIPSGVSIIALGLNGDLVTLDGPYTGAPAETHMVGKAGVRDALTQSLAGKEPAATVAVAPAAPADMGPDAPNPWWSRTDGWTGAHCLPAGRALVFWRAAPSQPLTGELQAGARRGKAPWPAGAEVIKAPRQLVGKSGQVKLVLVGSGKVMADIDVVEVKSENDMATMLAAMAGAGCHEQGRRVALDFFNRAKAAQQ